MILPRGIMCALALVLLLTACGYKGPLKSPSQIEAEEQKKKAKGDMPSEEP